MLAGTSTDVDNLQPSGYGGDPNSFVIGKVLIKTANYAHFLYKDDMPADSVKCEILYSVEDEGEILLEWDSAISELSMKVFVDMTDLVEEKKKCAKDLVAKLERVNHPNILNFIEPAIFLDKI